MSVSGERKERYKGKVSGETVSGRVFSRRVKVRGSLSESEVGRLYLRLCCGVVEVVEDT